MKLITLIITKFYLIITIIADPTPPEIQEIVQGLGQVLSHGSSHGSGHGSNPGSALPEEVKIGYTPYITTSGSATIVMSCTPDSYLTLLTLNATFPTEDLTCNGYHVFVAQFPGYTSVTRDLKVVTLPIAQSTVYRSFLNGYAFEVLTGTISDGKCSGDVFWSVVSNIPVNPLGCFSEGVTRFTVNYAYAQVFGHKCQSVCQLETNGLFTIDYPIRNSGK